MSPLEILGFGLAFFVASMLQSALGFGLGPVAIPVIVWLGRPLSDAVALSLGVVTVHTAYNSYVMRRHIPWPLVWRMSLIRWFAMPFGVWALKHYLMDDHVLAKQVVGALLLTCIALTFTSRPNAAHASLHRGWAWISGLSSGALAGALGMGGFPLVLYALQHDWGKEKTRAYLWALFLVGMPLAVLLMFVQIGPGSLVSWLYGLAFMPIAWLGSVIGLKITDQHSREVMRTLSFIVLGVLALSSLAAPWLSR